MKSADFEEYFVALHGVAPFPWQRRLARHVCEVNAWPRVIDLPTGAGKTACIDIALFHLLVSSAAGKPQEAARRVAFVVDRRIIVDEAANRAVRIAARIHEAQGGILGEAASILRALSGRTEIDIVTLRGGVAREKNLVRDPTTVAIVLSTVDQLGSRLLFRGYGVSDFAKSMHAGMFGFDTLLLLDEAHIAEPFRQTLAGVEREQARAATTLGVRPLRWSQLSATPSVSADFSIDEEDRRHPVLQRRLGADKPMQLLEVAKRDELSKKLLDLVKIEMNAAPQSALERPRIGIVVNRVATARDVHLALTQTFKDTIDAHLLIGRIRPIDRDRLMAKLTPVLKSSTTPRPGERPIVVVATQTIEVGADFDFHAMFIESASYPSVRQRVGRLNRLGIRETARGALILVRADADDDPVYGSTIARTWELLQEAASDGRVNLGIERAPNAVAGTAPSSPATPELSPSLLHLLAQTSPRPALEPDVSHFLHGFVEQAADIAVVWREGICGSDGNVDEAAAALVLDALPPLALEAMSLPLSSFRSWLRARIAKRLVKQVDAGDLEGDVLLDGEEDALETKVLVVDDDGVRALNASRVQPGSMVVVPCEWGGTDAYGFAPGATTRAEDFSLAARQLGQRAATLAFTPAIARSWTKDELDRDVKDDLFVDARRVIQRLEEDDADRADARAVCFEWVQQHAPSLRTEILELVADLERQRTVVDLLFDPQQGVRAIVIRARLPKVGDLSDDAVGLQRTVDVGLEEHCRGVAEYAARFANCVGCPEPLASDLRLAGRLHDLGKADPRFQAMLGADGSRLLAKGSSFDRRVILGARHECYSVALLDRYPQLVMEATDPELVRYLIGTHHGRGRGLQPVVEDIGASFELEVEGQELRFHGRPELSSVDSGWGELFGGLQRRYGVWGLAYLETVLRLADHRRSEAEVEGGM